MRRLGLLFALVLAAVAVSLLGSHVQTASAMICLSNCGSAPSAMQTPLGQYIGQLDVSATNSTSNGKVTITAHLGVNSCGVAGCSDSELLCSNFCAQDCTASTSCAVVWVDHQISYGIGSYAGASTACVNGTADLQRAKNSRYCIDPGGSYVGQCASDNDCATGYSCDLTQNKCVASP